MSAPDRDSRTHKPTPKRINEFRKRGEIALSRDLGTVVSMGGGMTLGFMLARHSVETLSQLTVGALSGLSGDSARSVALDAATSAFASASWPVMAGAIGGYVLSTAVQLGFPPAFKAPHFDLGPSLSLRGIPNLLAPKQAAGRALKSVAKVLFVGLCGAQALLRESDRFATEPVLDAAGLVDRTLSAGAKVAFASGGALFVLGILDYLVARRDLNAKMRMTAEEMKREMREQEGDPAIKRRRRQRMREISKRRLVSAVKSADVVVVNPTEYAVALRYKSKEDRAPRVVAKGRGIQAERIRDLARSAGIPIMPSPPLCRLLYKAVPEGREIPAAVYQAVAEILAYVFKLRARRGAR